MDQPKPLELKFDANTIDDLGAKLYSTLPPILAELVANGYDAGASEIHLEFFDDQKDQKRIVISDNGVGMSYAEIDANYLLVGRKKRDNEEERVDPKFKRPVMGKKGLGKLSFFGITDRAEVSTVKDNTCVTFVMDRNEIRKDSQYFPDFQISKTDQEAGTRVELLDVKREASFDIEGLKNSLANYFIFDKDFKVFIAHNRGEFEEISNDTRYKQLDIQFTWTFPNENFPNQLGISGNVFTTVKPLPKRLRGISLISRKKLVNLPELFPIDTSSFFFQYLTGYLEIDFVDDFDDDLIATDRKSLNWESILLSPLKDWLANLVSSSGLEGKWRELREKADFEKIQKDPEVIKVFETIKIEDAREDFKKSVKILSTKDIDADEAVEIVSEMTGEYPEFHRQYLTRELRNLTYNDYKREDYYEAVRKGALRYISKLRGKVSNNKDNEKDLINKSLQENNGILDICKKYSGYKNTENGAEITDDTKRAIQMGTRLLAEAMWSAFRNPINHQEPEDLQSSKIYTAEDCLDALSLLSHLFKRLDNSELRNP